MTDECYWCPTARALAERFEARVRCARCGHEENCEPWAQPNPVLDMPAIARWASSMFGRSSEPCPVVVGLGGNGGSPSSLRGRADAIDESTSYSRAVNATRRLRSMVRDGNGSDVAILWMTYGARGGVLMPDLASERVSTGWAPRTVRDAWRALGVVDEARVRHPHAQGGAWVLNPLVRRSPMDEDDQTMGRWEFNRIRTPPDPFAEGIGPLRADHIGAAVTKAREARESARLRACAVEWGREFVVPFYENIVAIPTEIGEAIALGFGPERVRASSSSNLRTADAVAWGERRLESAVDQYRRSEIRTEEREREFTEERPRMSDAAMIGELAKAFGRGR